MTNEQRKQWIDKRLDWLESKSGKKTAHKESVLSFVRSKWGG